MAEKVPEVIVDPADYQEVLRKLDLIEEKVEFTHSEMQQKIGKKLGRDVGVLYGLCIGLMIVVVYLLLAINLNETDLTTIVKTLFQLR